MCGRFSQSSSPQDYAELFGLESELSFPLRYNVSPNSDILACRISLECIKELVLLHVLWRGRIKQILDSSYIVNYSSYIVNCRVIICLS